MLCLRRVQTACMSSDAAHAGTPLGPSSTEARPATSEVEASALRARWASPGEPGARGGDEARDERALLRDTSPIDDRPAGGATVLMGHVPSDEARDLGHLIALDTGAGLWPTRGRLSALVLPERRVVTVDARWTGA